MPEQKFIRSYTKNCKCGCGEEFTTSSHNKLYVKGHFNRKAAAESYFVTSDRYMLRTEFLELMGRIKEERGMLWSELAEVCGYTDRGFSAMLYGGREQIRMATVERIKDCLNGVPMAPTLAQERKYTRLSRKVQSEMRAETLKDRSLQERKAKVRGLKSKLGYDRAI